MTQHHIAFVGCGNMGRSLIGGLRAHGVAAADIIAADPDATQVALAAGEFDVRTTSNNRDAVREADVIVLAVKPQQMPEVTRELASAIDTAQAVVVSIAAGIRIDALEQWLGADTAIVRAMPNTPALVGSGAAALCANANADDRQRKRAAAILQAAGVVVWVEDEALMDAVTAVSGSGPAYFFKFIEILIAAGVELGLPADAAKQLAIQTAFGAAKMAMCSEFTPAELRTQVTSPGGTTERALAVLAENDVEQGFTDAVRAACARSAELAREFGAQQ